jgi:transposase
MFMSVEKAFKCRFFPTVEQATQLAKNFDCACYVYKPPLEYRTAAWRQEKKSIGYHLTAAKLSEMIKNQNLATQIGDAAFAGIFRGLEYKARRHGRTLLELDRYFPPSNQCSSCGHLIDALPLSAHGWTVRLVAGATRETKTRR